jgi:hypothetical protein
VRWLAHLFHPSHLPIDQREPHCIARETELVIDDLSTHQRSRDLPEIKQVRTVEDELAILNRLSGYIRFIDIEYLVSVALSYGVCVRPERRVGQFVPEGVPVMRVSKGDGITPEREAHLLAALEIGPANSRCCSIAKSSSESRASDPSTTRRARWNKHCANFRVPRRCCNVIKRPQQSEAYCAIGACMVANLLNDPSTAISCVDQWHSAEPAGGISPRAAHTSVRKPLDLYGSCHRMKAAAFR